MSDDDKSIRFKPIGSAGVKRPKYEDGHAWGRWRYQFSNLTLNLMKEDKLIYGVDLERCNDSAQILNWIVQVAEKAFVTPEDIGYLVLALNDLSHRLQSKVCGTGKNKKFDFGAFLRN
jgi:hypothetical protein